MMERDVLGSHNGRGSRATASHWRGHVLERRCQCWAAANAVRTKQGRLIGLSRSHHRRLMETALCERPDQRTLHDGHQKSVMRWQTNFIRVNARSCPGTDEMNVVERLDDNQGVGHSMETESERRTKQEDRKRRRAGTETRVLTASAGVSYELRVS